VLDPVHFPRPVTRYWQATHPEAFGRGFEEMSRFYGMLVGSFAQRYVNGFCYTSHGPVAEGEIPQRFGRAEQAFREKLWRQQVREWDETFKPASVKAHHQLQSVDPGALPDPELVSYLARCRDHHTDMAYQHARFSGAAMLPTGDFLAHVGDWTGAAASELLVLLRGAAPVSAGASSELERLRAAVAPGTSARRLLESEEGAGQVLQALRSLPDEAGAAASAYLDLVGYRLLDGFDISGRFALEIPDALLRAVRVALEGKAPGSADIEDRIADVRGQVPEAHRQQFDELLEEARLTYRVRDERGVFSDIWAGGIMRRAVLAGGRRLEARGQVHDAEHFVDADFDEMESLLSGLGGPTADELAARFELRTSLSAKDAPPYLGDPPSPPPDLSGLPPAAQRVMRAMGVVMAEMFATTQAAQEEHLIRGSAASPGAYEGTARRLAGPSEFGRIVQGDVLVTESTSEAFNILLPLLGAIVTDSGGLLSHAAIVAREYGIPSVVGTREATNFIPDGARVRVDGTKGEVTVLG
jgi:pyruvate,water dikinase